MATKKVKSVSDSDKEHVLAVSWKPAVQSMGGDIVYTFKNNSEIEYVLKGRCGCWKTVDGEIIHQTGSFSNDITIKPHSTTKWKDCTIVQSEVMNKAKENNLSKVILHMLFKATDERGTPIEVPVAVPNKILPASIGA